MPPSQPPKKFVQVSLSSEFAALVRAQAEASDRSLAAQLEHWAKIGRALETVVPAATVSELKSGSDPGEILSRIGTFLLNQNPASLKARLATAQSPRYGVDDANPDIAIRFDTDGAQSRGAFDAAGNFIPAPTANNKTKRNDHRAKPASKPKRRSVASPRPAKSSSSNSVNARR